MGAPARFGGLCNPLPRRAGGRREGKTVLNVWLNMISNIPLCLISQRKEVADVSLAKPVQNAWSQPETLADKNKNSISDKKDQKKIVSIKSNNLNPLQNTKV